MNQFSSRTEAAKSSLEAEDRSDSSLAKIPATFFDLGQWVSSLIEVATNVSPVVSSWRVAQVTLTALENL